MKSEFNGAIIGVFYSPKLNTCLYSYSKVSKEYVSKGLHDVFSGDMIEDYFELIPGDMTMDRFEEYERKVKEYQ